MTRNVNADKTRIDYDINVYVREDYNHETRESVWNTDQWYLQVYEYQNGNTEEVSQPYLLTKEEAFCMNFVEVGDIDDGLDGWIGLDYMLQNYWEQMSDRLKEWLESFPKYKEDVRTQLVYM